MTDKEADQEAIRLLAKVDELRRELKMLEPQLAKARHAYGKRRGCDWFNEWNLRNTINMEQEQEKAA